MMYRKYLILSMLSCIALCCNVYASQDAKLNEAVAALKAWSDTKMADSDNDEIVHINAATPLLGALDQWISLSLRKTAQAIMPGSTIKSDQSYATEQKAIYEKALKRRKDTLSMRIKNRISAMPEDSLETISKKIGAVDAMAELIQDDISYKQKELLRLQDTLKKAQKVVAPTQPLPKLIKQETAVVEKDAAVKARIKKFLDEHPQKSSGRAIAECLADITSIIDLAKQQGSEFYIAEDKLRNELGTVLNSFLEYFQETIIKGFQILQKKFTELETTGISADKAEKLINIKKRLLSLVVLETADYSKITEIAELVKNIDAALQKSTEPQTSPPPPASTADEDDALKKIEEFRNTLLKSVSKDFNQMIIEIRDKIDAINKYISLFRFQNESNKSNAIQKLQNDIREIRNHQSKIVESNHVLKKFTSSKNISGIRALREKFVADVTTFAKARDVVEYIQKIDAALKKLAVESQPPAPSSRDVVTFIKNFIKNTLSQFESFDNYKRIFSDTMIKLLAAQVTYEDMPITTDSKKSAARLLQEAMTSIDGRIEEVDLYKTRYKEYLKSNSMKDMLELKEEVLTAFKEYPNETTSTQLINDINNITSFIALSELYKQLLLVGGAR